MRVEKEKRGETIEKRAKIANRKSKRNGTAAAWLACRLFFSQPLSLSLLRLSFSQTAPRRRRRLPAPNPRRGPRGRAPGDAPLFHDDDERGSGSGGGAAPAFSLAARRRRRALDLLGVFLCRSPRRRRPAHRPGPASSSGAAQAERPGHGLCARRNHDRGCEEAGHAADLREF